MLGLQLFFLGAGPSPSYILEVMALEEGPGRLLVWFDQAGITFDRSAAAIKTDLETSYGVYALQDVSKGQVLCR